MAWSVCLRRPLPRARRSRPATRSGRSGLRLTDRSSQPSYAAGRPTLPRKPVIETYHAWSLSLRSLRAKSERTQMGQVKKRIPVVAVWKPDLPFAFSFFFFWAPVGGKRGGGGLNGLCNQVYCFIYKPRLIWTKPFEFSWPATADTSTADDCKKAAL